MQRLSESAWAVWLGLMLCAAGPQGLDAAAASYFAGDLEGAAAGYEAVLLKLGPDGPAGTRYEALTSLAAVRAELGDYTRALVPLTEALAIADLLSAEGTWPDAPISARLQLAETLRLAELHRDAEAAAWDLLDHTVAAGNLPLSIHPIRLILLSAVSQGAGPQQLADLMFEWDVALGVIDGYRLAVPPPPEPIVVGLEGLARQYATQGAFEEATGLFAAITALDEARGAPWRLVQDHSQLGFVSLQAGDLARAGAALDRADSLLGDAVTAEAWTSRAVLFASRSALAYERGRLQDAISLCKQAIAAAETSGDRYRQAVLQGRLGRLRGLPLDHDFAAALYDDLGAPAEAARERALAALAGPVRGSQAKFAEAVAALGEMPMPSSVQEIGLLVDHRALAAGAVGPEEWEAGLLAVQRGWFDQEEPERLLEAVLLQLDRTILDGGDVPAAVAAVEALQEQVGLELEGWYAAYARGLLEHGDARIEAWQEAAARAEWGRRHPLSRVPTPGEPPLPEPPGVDVHTELLRELVAAGRHAEALALVERHASAGPARSDPRTEAGRRNLRAVSFRGGERHPAEVREEINAWLAPRIVRPELEPVWRPPTGTIAVRSFLLDRQLHIYLVPPEGAVKPLSSPTVQWLDTMIAHRPSAGRSRRQAKKPDEHWEEVGHLFGRAFGLIEAAETVYWVPAGPFVGVPLEDVPMPGNKTIGEVTSVMTLESLSRSGGPVAPR